MIEKFAEDSVAPREIMRDNFIALRRVKGWSLEEASQLSGLDVKTLTDVEEGRDFDVICFLKLCLIYCSESHETFFLEQNRHE